MGSHIVALAIEGRGVVQFPEMFEYPGEIDDRRVEGYLHNLRVPGEACTDLFVGRVWKAATHIAGGYITDTVDFFEYRLDAPEATGSQGGDLGHRGFYWRRIGFFFGSGFAGSVLFWLCHRFPGHPGIYLFTAGAKKKRLGNKTEQVWTDFREKDFHNLLQIPQEVSTDGPLRIVPVFCVFSGFCPRSSLFLLFRINYQPWLFLNSAVESAIFGIKKRSLFLAVEFSRRDIGT